VNINDLVSLIAFAFVLVLFIKWLSGTLNRKFFFRAVSGWLISFLILGYPAIENWYLLIKKSNVESQFKDAIAKGDWDLFKTTLYRIQDDENLSDLFVNYAEILFSNYVEKKDWLNIKDLAEPLKDYDKLKNVYNYAQVIIITKTNVIGRDPIPYFINIDPGYGFFIDAIRRLAFYYTQLNDQHMRRGKFKRISEHLENIGALFPIYYWIKMNTLSKANYDELDTLYKTFLIHNAKYINLDDYSVHIHLKLGESFNPVFAPDLVCIMFVLNCSLAESAQFSHLETEMNTALDAVEKLIEEHGLQGLINVSKDKLGIDCMAAIDELAKLRPKLKSLATDKGPSIGVVVHVGEVSAN